MRRLVREHHIKTIVALAHPAEHPLSIREKALAKELGVKWVHVPIVDDRNGPTHRTLAYTLDAAAAELAKPENQPVYFHCHHGINRASMVQMAYRMRYCGWSLEQATAEISKHFGLVAVNHGPDYRHMTDYYRDYVLPSRQAQASRPSTATKR
jgi:protein tyrosine/serine phosphatase